MARFELDPQFLYQIAEKISSSVNKIDSNDPVYQAAFDGVPETLRDQWVAAIKEGASLIGLDSRAYGKELVRIAIENGLAPRDARRLPKDLYSDLRSRIAVLHEAVFAHEGFGSSSHVFSTGLPRYGRKR